MLRIVSYNLLVGFQDKPERKAAALAWLTAQQPDILALQEMNGYTPERLTQEALQWGHPHSILAKTEGYSPAITSRYDFESHERVLAGFRTGLICARTADVDVFVVHLNVFGVAERLREATEIVTRVNASVRAGRHALVLGDFNALSQLDGEYYSAHPAVLEYQLQCDRKYDWHNVKDGALDYSVMNVFAAAGLVDVVAQRTRATSERLSYPTPLLEPDPKSGSHLPRSMRLDYILASPGLAERCRTALVVRDAATAMQSDHFPVIADFEL